jgi:hypothetical protein
VVHRRGIHEKVDGDHLGQRLRMRR